MSDANGWEITVRRTIVLSRTLTNKSYPDMNLDEAMAFERNLDRDEKIQAFIENLAYASDEQIEITEIVEPVTNSTKN